MFPYIWDDFIGRIQIKNIQEFQNAYCCGETKIEFLGLFDTVYGIYLGSHHRNLSRVFFKNRLLGRNVKTAVHLLARDETRRQFRAILFENKTESDQTLEQIWMPGVHSDIGGGYVEDFLSKIALMTMLDRIREYTLLKLDFRRSRSLRESIEQQLGQNRIVVNNEIQGVFRLAPLRWGGSRNPNLSDQFQSIHPIYKALEGRSFTTKSQTTNFFPSPQFPFNNYASVKSLENLHGKSL